MKIYIFICTKVKLFLFFLLFSSKKYHRADSSILSWVCGPEILPFLMKVWLHTETHVLQKKCYFLKFILFRIQPRVIIWINVILKFKLVKVFHNDKQHVYITSDSWSSREESVFLFEDDEAATFNWRARKVWLKKKIFQIKVR